MFLATPKKCDKGHTYDSQMFAGCNHPDCKPNIKPLPIIEINEHGDDDFATPQRTENEKETSPATV